MGERQARARRLLGATAAELVEDGMMVGLGTGSTVDELLPVLAARRLDIRCVASSERTARAATDLGLLVIPAAEVIHLDLTIDGADEIDPDLNLTKGGGGALTRERIVAALADRFVVIADESKRVERLGAFGTPLELLDFAPAATLAAVAIAGGERAAVRPGRSDNGNLLADAHFGEIADPMALSATLAAIPGLIAHGLFPGTWVERALVSDGRAVRELRRSISTR